MKFQNNSYKFWWLFQLLSNQRVKSAKNPSRQVVGKRFYIQNKYPKRHQPAVNMLKIEGATCTPATNATAVAPSPSPTPRVVNASTQVNPQLGSTRPVGISRFGVVGKSGGGVWVVWYVCSGAFWEIFIAVHYGCFDYRKLIVEVHCGKVQCVMSALIQKKMPMAGLWSYDFFKSLFNPQRGFLLVKKLKYLTISAVLFVLDFLCFLFV